MLTELLIGENHTTIDNNQNHDEIAAHLAAAGLPTEWDEGDHEYSGDHGRVVASTPLYDSRTAVNITAPSRSACYDYADLLGLRWSADEEPDYIPTTDGGLGYFRFAIAVLADREDVEEAIHRLDSPHVELAEREPIAWIVRTFHQ